MASSSSSQSSQSKERQDHFSQDIKSILGPIVIDIDKNMVATQQSQQDLSQEIERLVAELEVFTDIAEPPKLQSALDKLVDARKKLTLSTKLLHQTHSRLERLEDMLDK
ncbi:hypothetical protein BCR42DRAFT_417226 [Absidia repens]|uniref:Biogenesis of lysosome-related organelles complex 1 subunit 7 n=1 Tax=Absidia repens TaxID=90262 RepID=A0A1X2IDI8_9FUNG|nr:hypothetical protein BCR42DRAFT_417226 [Absidia repens]